MRASRSDIPKGLAARGCEGRRLAACGSRRAVETPGGLRPGIGAWHWQRALCCRFAPGNTVSHHTSTRASFVASWSCTCRARRPRVPCLARAVVARRVKCCARIYGSFVGLYRLSPVSSVCVSFFP